MLGHDSTSRNRGTLRSAGAVVFTFIALCLLPSTMQAYDRYSVNGDATNCRSCHGDFRAANYTSLVDGMAWGNLHNLHRTTMLNGDCSVCHGGSMFPVLIAQSAGGLGMAPISCVGCHGREQDNTALTGRGAGLRQHHNRRGVTACATCHVDANPVNYTPVPESVLPLYYAQPGTSHPMIPTESCNGNGSENFAGAPLGLDNDGDNLYDGADPDCQSVGAREENSAPALAVRGFLPNPSVGHMRAAFTLPTSAPAVLDLLDVGGRLVTSIRIEAPRSGYNVVDLGDRGFTAGCYLIRVTQEGRSATAKAILAR